MGATEEQSPTTKPVLSLLALWAENLFIYELYELDVFSWESKVPPPKLPPQ